MFRFQAKTLIADISSGLLVALVGIPQCLAYALLSGIPPVYGLTTAAIPGAVGALLGRSARVTVGPTNTTGLIIMVSMTPYLGHGGVLGTRGLVAMATLAALAGLVRLAIGFMRIERIFDFIPEAVLIGFGTGAALLIGFMQLDEALGLKFTGVQNLVDETIAFVKLHSVADSIKYPAVLIAFGTVSISLAMKKFAPALPTPLLLLLGVTGLTYGLGLGPEQGVPLVGGGDSVSAGWPEGALPFQDFGMVSELFLPAVAIAFIGTLELLITLKNHQEFASLNGEIRSQGWANLIGSCASSFPASTSLTRSALLSLNGAKSRLAPLSAALFVIPILFFAGSWIAYIPQALIAGLLLATAVSMIDKRSIANVSRATPATKILFMTTLLSTLIFSFHVAILVGCFLGFAIFLYQASTPQVRCYGVLGDGALIEGDKQERIVIQVSGSLYYAAARSLPSRIAPFLTSDIKHMTLDLSHSQHLRYTAVMALEEISAMVDHAGAKWSVVGASSAFKQMCRIVTDKPLPFSEDSEIKQILQTKS